MKKTFALCLTLAIALSLVVPASLSRVQAQADNQETTRARGGIVNTYREDDDERQTATTGSVRAVRQNRQRPVWVEEALERSFDYLNNKAGKAGTGETQSSTQSQQKQHDAREEFALLSAEQDDLGLTHVRLKQIHRGVPVFGAQMITRLDATQVRTISGQTFDAVNVETEPVVTPEQAIEAAKRALNYEGQFAKEPEAELVLLPHEIFEDEADRRLTLTYRVELLIEGGTENTARHQYFVNAKDGGIVWHFDSLTHGNGRGLYNNPVTINTTLVSGFPAPRYEMRDNSRGGMHVVDMGDSTSGVGTLFTSFVDVWGDGTRGNRQSAAVDAHYGGALTWDYYLSRFGRRGIDGNGYTLKSRVHYGSNYSNAFWNGSVVTYGDSNGTTRNSFVTIDIVGHEITHGVTEKTAGLIYAKQSGALNESFSDIFGTMIEHYSGRNPDYLIGEDTGAAFRSMVNPANFGHPNHYSIRFHKGICTPSGSNDNCGVHSNSGISNNAFYLLAEGGVNATSGVNVTGIGRSKASQIFYRALTLYLGPNAKFIDARLWTLQAAADLYGAGSMERSSVAKAWEAVGVKHVVYGAIREKWESLGAENGLLGEPLTDELGTPDGVGRFNHFQGGSIYWTPTTGAHEVHGTIRDKWAALSWERGPMGYPTSDELVTADRTGRVSFFQRGAIFWHPAVGAYAVYGSIAAKYSLIGYERSSYGYPVTDELGTPDGIGRFNHFQGGSIYWTPSTGAHLIYGAIRDKWASLGWERSFLGYPTSDEIPTPDGKGRMNYFQRGRIYWYPNTGAYVAP